MGDGRVVIAYLHNMDVSALFAESLIKLLAAEQGRVGARVSKRSGVNVAHGRNEVVRMFLSESPHEWLLTLDSDMVFHPDLLSRLLAVADPVERPVVSGLYFGTSNGAIYPHLYQLMDDPERPGAIRSVRLNEYRKGLMRVTGTGAGCMLIHRSVLEQMRDAQFDPAFPWYQETADIGQAVTSEDITFCLRVQQLGHPVYVDTRIVCGHVKPMILDDVMFDALRAATDGADDVTLAVEVEQEGRPDGCNS